MQAARQMLIDASGGAFGEPDDRLIHRIFETLGGCADQHLRTLQSFLKWALRRPGARPQGWGWYVQVLADTINQAPAAGAV